uniref:NAD(P)(+)--arginine ADP-ribosyltransferase n=1 Tax=Sinocyclocheilus anshuiensis TaxID=1608454 RepID=A0A671K3D0_9TELE
MLLQDHRTAVDGHIFPLDMAPNSVDDQYDGCTRKMAHLVETIYLKKELNISRSNFKVAWQEGETNFKKPENNLTRNHSIAIYVYTGDKVFRDFNNDTRYGKQNYTNETYKWYSLNFLLTDAIQILKRTQNRCYDTYRGTKCKCSLNVLSNKVRFGSFTSSTYNQNRAKFFGNVSCFEIHTCEGANITKYSKLSREQEVLIPPYEVFNVTAVKNRTDQPDLWCETVYTLKSSGNISDLNCALFKKPTETIQKYYVLL